MYPSVEMLLVQEGKLKFPSYRVATETPADLPDRLPVITFRRFGGSDPDLTIDRANVDVDVYASTWASADDIARLVRVWLRAELPGRRVTTASGTAVVALVSTISAPSRRPTEDHDLYRAGGSYQVRTHG